jgi:hypothetical protein
MEQTPLGKAEWIKLYGALFGKEKENYYLMELSRIIMMRNNSGLPKTNSNRFVRLYVSRSVVCGKGSCPNS